MMLRAEALRRQSKGAASPSNITVNVLNANTFFAFDYEPDAILLNATPQGKDRKSPYYSCPAKGNTRSAQYNRKLVLAPNNFRCTNMYGRIKKVQNLIEERKRIINSSMEPLSSQKETEEPTLPELKTKRNAKKMEMKTLEEDDRKYHQYLFQSIPIKSGRSDSRWEEKHTNSYSDNYKNRRRLAERVGNKKTSRANNSPLRRDISPIEFAQKQLKDNSRWNPYPGKLLMKKNLEFLKQSIQGNKINYTITDPEKAHRYPEALALGK